MRSNLSRIDLIRPTSHAPTNAPTNRRRFGLLIPACVLALTCLALTCLGATSPSFARGSFDGEWSVVIVTRDGACTPTLRYPVAISNGIVGNAGDTPVTVQGRVAPNGIVRVVVQSGGSWADGSGRLSTTTGSGVWRGQGISGLCEGTWQAERRGSGAQVMERGGAPIYGYAPQQPRQYYPGR
jgi:hypothetical protein